jgi:hypothetical protein
MQSAITQIRIGLVRLHFSPKGIWALVNAALQEYSKSFKVERSAAK